VADATREVVPVAGRDYPVDVAQARAWFHDDGACADFLARLRWPAGFRCPQCRSSDAFIEASGRFRCRSSRRRTSVTAGTIFEKTRVPLTVRFEVMWLMTTNKNGISAAYLHRVLPVSSYQTAWTTLAKLRQAMAPTHSVTTPNPQVSRPQLTSQRKLRPISISDPTGATRAQIDRTSRYASDHHWFCSPQYSRPQSPAEPLPPYQIQTARLL
jgi:hypothetical protein